MKGWEYKKAKELVTFRIGKLDSNAAETEGKYPFFTCAQETFKINSYAFDTECVLLAGNNAAGIFPLKYYKGKFNAYQRTYIIEPKGLGLLNIRFLYESFKPFLKQFEQTSTGATTKFLTMGILNNLWLPLPPLPIQRKIAAVLSAYDDLIENNNRRIAILEKMAEELYREWFVRLRFPGHEKVRIVKGVPEGWEVKKLAKVADITYGFPFEGARFNSNGIGKPIIRIRNIPESSTADYTDEVVNEKYIVKKGDFLVGMDGEFHMNHWFGDDAYLVQRVCRVKAKSPGHAGYLAKALYGPIKFYESILMGATVGHLGAKHLNSIDILIPSKSLDRQLTLFNQLFKQKINYSTKNNALRRTRDMLLSRLMSGKIDVERLDIKFPASMMEEGNA